MFNDGKLSIYKKIPSKSEGGQPIEVLEFYGFFYYSELSFTADEYYKARQAETEISKRIRIHQDKSIGNNHVAIVAGVQYGVGRTYSAEAKGIAITDITLERVVNNYDIA